MQGCPRARHLKLPPDCLPVMPSQGLTHGGWRSQLRERRQLPRQALTLKAILSETGFQGSRPLAQQTLVQKTQVLSQGGGHAGRGEGTSWDPGGKPEGWRRDLHGKDRTSQERHELQLPPLPAHWGRDPKLLCASSSHL